MCLENYWKKNELCKLMHNHKMRSKNKISYPARCSKYCIAQFFNVEKKFNSDIAMSLLCGYMHHFVITFNLELKIAYKLKLHCSSGELFSHAEACCKNRTTHIHIINTFAESGPPPIIILRSSCALFNATAITQVRCAADARCENAAAPSVTVLAKI